MFKNVASQKIQLFAFDTTTGAPKTGDAANITAYVSKDHGAVTVLGDTSATEMDSTNAKGMYLFDLTQGETNADELTFSAKSSTSNISIVVRTVTTNPPLFTTLAVNASGRVDLGLWLGSAPNALISGRVETVIGAVTAAAITSAAFASGAFDAVWTVTTRALTSLTGFRLSATGIQDIWDALTSALTTASSIGKRLADNITGDAYVRLGAPAGASVSADIAAAKADTAGIKTKTDSLTFTVANQADVNVLDWKSATAPAMTGDAFARLGAPAGASVSADVAAAKADTAAIKTKTDSLTFTVANQIDSNVIDWKGATAPAMTGDAYARLGAPAGASVSADVAAVKSDTTAVKTDVESTGVVVAAASKTGYRLSATGVDDLWAYLESAIGTANSIGLKLKNTLPQRITKNTALAKFPFVMVDSADHLTGKTGLTITAQRSIDGAAFGACANSAVEVSAGVYYIDLVAADLNGNSITLKFSATGADTRLLTLITQPAAA